MNNDVKWICIMFAVVIASGMLFLTVFAYGMSQVGQECVSAGNEWVKAGDGYECILK